MKSTPRTRSDDVTTVRVVECATPSGVGRPDQPQKSATNAITTPKTMLLRMPFPMSW